MKILKRIVCYFFSALFGLAALGGVIVLTEETTPDDTRPFAAVFAIILVLICAALIRAASPRRSGGSIKRTVKSAYVDGLDLDEIARKTVVNPYMDTIPQALEISFPIPHYSGIILRPGEELFYAAPAMMYSDKEKVTGYTGGGGGVSVRVAKGVTLHSGSSGRRAIREKVRDFKPGDIVVTTQRVVFTGQEGSFEFSAKKITAVKMEAPGHLVVQCGQASRNIALDVDVASDVFAAIQTAATSQDDMGEIIRGCNGRVTPEQEQKMEQVRNEVAQLIARHPRRYRK